MECARRPARLGDFPNELLDRIFKFGSELKYPEDEKEIFANPGERRRKSFASLVRSVCRRWRDVLDHSDDGFWIMCLTLELEQGVPEHPGSRATTPTCSFLSNMERSQNCDLVLAIDMITDEREYQGDSWESLKRSRFLQCLRRALGSSTYMKQISVIRFTGDVTAAKEGLGLLRAVRTAPRLKTLIFTGLELPRYLRPVPFEIIWSGSLATRFIFIYRGLTENISTPARKPSFYLETLQIPSAYWLKPLGISNDFLRLILCPWFPFWPSTIQGLSNLVSLELTLKYDTSELEGDRIISKEGYLADVKYGMSFPFLERLSIQSVFSFAFTFLAINTFPSLKSARIAVTEYPPHLHHVKTGGPFRSEDVDVNSMENSPSTAFPHLTELSIRFPSSFTGFNIYKLFLKSPLIFLELRWRADPHTMPLNDPGKDISFTDGRPRDILSGSQSKLRTLICDVPYSAIAMLITIIRSLDLVALEVLDMSIPDFPKGDPGIVVGNIGEGKHTEKPSQASIRLKELLTAAESLGI